MRTLLRLLFARPLRIVRRAQQDIADARRAVECLGNLSNREIDELYPPHRDGASRS